MEEIEIETFEGVYEPAEDSWMMCNYLPNDLGSVLEIGCGSGIISVHLAKQGNQVTSVDINPKATEVCKSIVSDNVEIHTGDSVKYLTELMPKFKKQNEKISLFYLDSFDVDWQSSDRSAAHHLKEITAIINYISEETLIVIDDAPILAPMKIEDKKLSIITEHPAPKPFVGGKGYLVNEFAYANDATLYFSNYQTAWYNFKKKL